MAVIGTTSLSAAGDPEKSDDESSHSPSAPAPDEGQADPPAEREAPAPAAAPVPILPESREGSLLWRIRGIIEETRPHQWVKNTFVLAPVVFAKELNSPALIKRALGAFAIFCLLSGAVYTLNDLVDAPADRIHPVKKNRPIASGRVPISVGWAMAFVLMAGALTAAFLGPRRFFYVAVAYLTLNLAYSFRLKKIAYLDVACISMGFVLRVLAGGYATHTPISLYMLSCTLFLSLFLGFGKRRHELAGTNATKQRSALEAYTPRALTTALAITGLASVVSYVAYTLDPKTVEFFETPWIALTTVFTLFGVVRFLQLVVGRPKAESPTQEMLRDVPFVLNIVIWVLVVIVLLYQVKLSSTAALSFPSVLG